MRKQYEIFYSGYSKLDERSGDLYVKRNNNCWEINAGVNSMGFSPGFGKACDIADGSPAYEIYEEFLKKLRTYRNSLSTNWVQHNRYLIKYLKKSGITFTKK